MGVHGADVAEGEQHAAGLARLQPQEPVVGQAGVDARPVDDLARLGPAGRAGGVDDLVGGRRVGRGAVVDPGRPAAHRRRLPVRQHRDASDRGGRHGRAGRVRVRLVVEQPPTAGVRQLVAPLRQGQPAGQPDRDRPGRRAGEDRDQVVAGVDGGDPDPVPWSQARRLPRLRGGRDVARQLEGGALLTGHRVHDRHGVRVPVHGQVEHVEQVVRSRVGVRQLVAAEPRFPHHADGVPVVVQVAALGHGAMLPGARRGYGPRA